MKINPNQIIGNSRNNRRSNYNVGDKIIVKLDGKEYSTEIIDKIPNGRYSIIEPGGRSERIYSYNDYIRKRNCPSLNR